MKHRSRADVPVDAARLNRVLSGLADEPLQALLGRAGLVNLDNGRVLYRQDRAINAVYFPIRGIVSVTVGTYESAKVEVATVGNEGVVGVTAAIGVSRAPGQAIVQVPGQAIKVDIGQLQEVSENDPRLSLALHRYLYLFLRQVMQAGACNRLHTAEERCARWLLMAHDRAGTGCFPLTQRFIAEMMGTRRANVNVALALFRRAGAIDYTYRQINILDRKQLESFSCPCYQLLRSAEAAVTR